MKRSESSGDVQVKRMPYGNIYVWTICKVRVIWRHVKGDQSYSAIFTDLSLASESACSANKLCIVEVGSKFNDGGKRNHLIDRQQKTDGSFAKAKV
ncbi:hypothetical protein M514_04638 [Trichuris suis]|uniref:Uncharacterized protein n=1 Tax=Trichuris suis TaxID=68888 RepID=A0A085NV61_9BILA|nr:hypothetical protein M513_04638 [Trichuris suis]KFD73357.1 hypothetical protein M514_04638 [Trichuris suis]